MFYKPLSATLICASLFLTAPAFSGDTSAEKEAVNLFHQFCVLTNGNTAAIEKRMEPIIAANAGGKISSELLSTNSGIKSEHAWGIKLGAKHQKLLVTTVPGICAVHVESGDRKIIKEEFVRMVEFLAKILDGKALKIEEKQRDNFNATYYSYAIDVPAFDHESMFAITVADSQSSGGTKHLMTYSILKRSEIDKAIKKSE